jgi:hypothetical protein
VNKDQSTSPASQKNSHEQEEKRPSSPGDSPRTMTPHDVQPDHATWRDRTERTIAGKDKEHCDEALLDEANDLSFPASDPIAIPSSPSERDKVKHGVKHRDDLSKPS